MHRIDRTAEPDSRSAGRNRGEAVDIHPGAGGSQGRAAEAEGSHPSSSVRLLITVNDACSNLPCSTDLIAGSVPAPGVDPFACPGGELVTLLERGVREFGAAVSCRLQQGGSARSAPTVGPSCDRAPARSARSASPPQRPAGSAEATVSVRRAAARWSGQPGDGFPGRSNPPGRAASAGPPGPDGPHRPRAWDCAGRRCPGRRTRQPTWGERLCVATCPGGFPATRSGKPVSLEPAAVRRGGWWSARRRRNPPGRPARS